MLKLQKNIKYLRQLNISKLENGQKKRRRKKFKPGVIFFKEVKNIKTVKPVKNNFKKIFKKKCQTG